MTGTMGGAREGGVMATAGRVVLQERIVVSGDSSVGETRFAQDQQYWQDLGAYRDAVFTLRLIAVSVTSTDTIDIKIGTTDAKRDENNLKAVNDGPVWDIVEWLGFGTRTTESWFKNSVEWVRASGTTGPFPIDRWVFWFLEVNGTSGPWSAEFEIFVTVKG